MKYTDEAHRRSMTKSIIWRIFGIVFMMLITFIVTRNWVFSGLITMGHNVAFIFIYYGHERFWMRIKKGRDSKARPILRMVLYELVLGNLVLGALSYFITGSWRQTTMITLIYILNKCWMYIAYDKWWEKVEWGKNSETIIA